MARYIALDYGTRRVGIAVTDSGAMIASPEDTCSPEALPNVLKALIKAEPCAGLVVGVPGLLTGERTDSSEAIDLFIKQLKASFPGLPIECVDEDHTSREASFAMVQSGMRKSKRRQKGQVDKVAAALILQRFLDQR